MPAPTRPPSPFRPYPPYPARRGLPERGSFSETRGFSNRQGFSERHGFSAGLPYHSARPARDPLVTLGVVLALGAAALITLAAAAAVLFFVYFQVSGRILPGVRAGAMPLGGMTVEQAAVELHRAWNVEHTLVATDGLHSWSVPPASLGLALDPGETAQNAYTVGHDQGLLAELGQMANSLWKGWEIVPVLRFDPEAARLGLESLSSQASQPPVDASFYVQGSQLVPVPGKIGYTFNLDETLARLQANPRAVMESSLLTISLKPLPPRIPDAAPFMVEAQRLLDAPLALKAYDPVSDETLDLPISRETVGTWLSVQATDQGPQVSLDDARVTAALESMNQNLGPERYIEAGKYGPPLAQAVREGKAYTLLLSHHPTTYTVQASDTLLKIGWKVGIPFFRIQQANPGLNPDALWAGQELVLPSKDELLPLPVVANKRIVIGISEQRMWVYENGQQVKKFIISTGIDRSPTQPGVFQVQTHDPNAYASVWDLYMPNFLGIYEAWPGFMNGIHGLPTLSNGRRLWANILGRPASYGCIILDLDAAAWLYGWAEEGVVVEIRE